MSDLIMPKTTNETASKENSLGPKAQENSQAIIAFNKNTGQVSLSDPLTGQVIIIDAKTASPDKSAHEPLSSNEFRRVLERIDSLGLTWTPNRPPLVRPKNENNSDALSSEEFETIQNEYPTFQKELAAIISYALTGNAPLERLAGNKEDVEEKAKAVRDIVATADYRAEYFFRHALKVPYLENIDWEVVLKLSEKNVKEMPGNTYALLSLIFHDPTIVDRDPHNTLTVAVNSRLLNKLINTFTEIKKSLEVGQSIAQTMNDHPKNTIPTEPDNGNH